MYYIFIYIYIRWTLCLYLKMLFTHVYPCLPQSTYVPSYLYVGVFVDQQTSTIGTDSAGKIWMNYQKPMLSFNFFHVF